jgi:hypothetical protein
MQYNEHENNDEHSCEISHEVHEVEICELPPAGGEGGQGRRVLPLLLAWGLQDPHTTLRRWRWPLMALTCLALALLLFFSQTLTAFWQLASSSGGMSPVALPSYDDLFYFPNLPTWGRFSLDGRPLSYAPTASSQLPLRLSRGAHRLIWQAEPFYPQSCAFSVPPASGEKGQSCAIRPMQPAPGVSAGSAFQLSFPVPLSLQQLPPTQRQALISATQALLDTLQSKEAVQPGEWYQSSLYGNSFQHATQPLSAQLRFLLTTDISTPASCLGVTWGEGCSIAGADCRLFCTLPWPATGNEWDVAAIMQPVWRYIGTRTATTFTARSHEDFVTFRVSWQQARWQVSFHEQSASIFENPGCITTVDTLLRYSSYPPLQEQQELSWSFFSGANRASGCVALGNVLGPAGISLSPFSGALFLQRFGVLLAANKSAHLLLPALPQASLNEQSIALAIMDNPAAAS